MKKKLFALALVVVMLVALGATAFAFFTRNPRGGGAAPADPEDAAEAAILHDCTKKERLDGQLALCDKYGVEPDALEKRSEKLLHAKTGAALARVEFGVSPAVENAICWHTTGRAGMSRNPSDDSV